jgi:pilus assembly protein Flp/PilA
MLDLIRPIVFDEGGATAVEYGLIAALISIVGVTAFTSMGSSLDTLYRYISGLMQDASS